MDQIRTQTIGGMPAATRDPGPQGSGLGGGEFETFLRMLTAQIRHQDPMNPMEGSDFAVQLATFSGVEQQVRANALLQELVAAGGRGGLEAMADWVGREVRTTAPVQFADTPLVLDIQPDPTADRVLLVAQDTHGRRISVEDIGTGAGLVEWYGRDPTGQRLPAGAYAFRVESYRGDALVADRAAGAYVRIVEAERSPDGVQFLLLGGGVARPDQIEAVRTSPID